MVDFEQTRRQFGMGIATGLGVAIAGCMGDDGDATDAPDGEDEDGADDGQDGGAQDGTDGSSGETDTPTETDSEDGSDGGDSEYALSVTIEDEEGEPIEEADVSVGDESVETGADGVAEFSLQSGDYTVAADAVGYSSTEEDVEIGDGDVDISVALEKPDPDGSAMLEIYPENEDGELVEIGFDLTIEHEDNLQRITRSYVGDWQGEVEIDGELQTLGEEGEWEAARIRANQPSLLYAGEYSVTIEPNEANDFEAVEDTVEFSQEDLEEQAGQEVTYVLEGAMSDEERERQNAITVDDRHHLDGKHDPFTEWAIGVEDGSDEAGARVVQQEWADEDHHHWDIEPVDEEEKWHRITAAHTDDLVMEAQDVGSGLLGYTELFVEEYDGNDRQLYRFVPLDETHPFVEEGEDVYKVICKHNRAAFGPADGEPEPGTMVVTWYYAGAGDQQLMLSPHD